LLMLEVSSVIHFKIIIDLKKKVLKFSLRTPFLHIINVDILKVKFPVTSLIGCNV